MILLAFDRSLKQECLSRQDDGSPQKNTPNTRQCCTIERITASDFLRRRLVDSSVDCSAETPHLLRLSLILDSTILRVVPIHEDILFDQEIAMDQMEANSASPVKN
jgi:hypothetical protein